jgi:AcrR family transcriptional regulator
MPAEGRKTNRGPSAAGENRRALLAAARSLMSQHGYHVSLHAIAREAGVGQGVLYRNFPTRLDLAFAVFEENFAELELIAADPDPGAFARFWDRLVDMTVTDTAFIEMSIDARREVPYPQGVTRFTTLVAPALARAQAAGRVDQSVTPDDVMLAERMVYGIVVTSPDPATARSTIDRALRLAQDPIAAVAGHPPSTRR